MQEIMKSFDEEMNLPEPEDLQEAFDQIDANQDGKLTPKELTEAMKKDSDLAKLLLTPNGAVREEIIRELGLEGEEIFSLNMKNF